MPEERAATGENGSCFVIPTKTAIYFHEGHASFQSKPNFSTIFGAVNWITSSTSGSTSAVNGAAEGYRSAPV
jgi:hypothetical protein